MVTPPESSPQALPPGEGLALVPVPVPVPVTGQIDAATAVTSVDFDLDFDPTRTEPALNPWPSAVPDTAALRTQPLLRSQSLRRQGPRVLVVSADADERMYLRARLAIAGLVWMDEATSTTQAMSAMGEHGHVLIFVNLDSPIIDGWSLAGHLHALNPRAKPVATTAAHAMLNGWHPLTHWHRTQWHKKALQAGFHDVLAKPIQVKCLVQIIGRVMVTSKK